MVKEVYGVTVLRNSNDCNKLIIEHICKNVSKKYEYNKNSENKDIVIRVSVRLKSEKKKTIEWNRTQKFLQMHHMNAFIRK